MSTDSKTLYTYTKLYEEDPFSEETLQQVNQSINSYSYISGVTKRRPTGYNNITNYTKQ